MTELPGEFPLPEEASQRQLSLLRARIEAGRDSSRARRQSVVAVAAVILLGGLLVAPAPGIGGRLLALIQSPPGPPEVQSPVWSPDGRRIAFLRSRDGNTELYVVNADGSGRRRLMRDARFFGTPAWSPDGQRIAFAGVLGGIDGVYVVNADGGFWLRLAHRGDALAWSPDGRKIAFFSGSRIYLANTDGSGHRPLTKALSGRKRSLAWSPDGRKLAFLNQIGCGDFCFGLFAVNSSGSGLRNLTSKLGAGRGPGAGPASDPAWAPDGRRIAFVRLNAGVNRSPVYVVKTDGSGLRNLTPKPVRAYTDPAWSPDGRRIAFVGERDDNSEVYVMNPDGGGQRSLTHNPAVDADPAWSPDGRKIAFVTNRDGRSEVYVMNADGSGQRSLAQRSP